VGGAEGGFHDGFGGAGEGDDSAVVVGIAGAVEDQRAFHLGNCVLESRYFQKVAAFGKIGDAFE
jgi:hypothetical protein